MKIIVQGTFAALVVAAMTLMPAAANASTPGVSHGHDHVLRDHTPRVHEHGAHAHRS